MTTYIESVPFPALRDLASDPSLFGETDHRVQEVTRVNQMAYEERLYLHNRFIEDMQGCYEPQFIEIVKRELPLPPPPIERYWSNHVTNAERLRIQWERERDSLS